MRGCGPRDRVRFPPSPQLLKGKYMISNESQFYRITLNEKNVDLAWKEGQEAAIGGKSQIFQNHEDRMKRI
jgi:hypothetical protein